MVRDPDTTLKKAEDRPQAVFWFLRAGGAVQKVWRTPRSKPDFERGAAVPVSRP